MDNHCFNKRFGELLGQYLLSTETAAAEKLKHRLRNNYILKYIFSNYEQGVDSCPFGWF